MSLTRIRTNTWALRAYSRLRRNTEAMAVRRQRLVTGRRINRAEDDSAAYFISERLRSKIRGQNQGLQNVRDTRAMLTVAEGAMRQQQDILQAMKEKAVQAANATASKQERTTLDLQIRTMLREVEQIAEETEYNGQRLLDGSGGSDGTFTFQQGTSAGDRFQIAFAETSLDALGIEKAFDPGTTIIPESFVPEIDLGGYTGPEGAVRKIKGEDIDVVRGPEGEIDWWEIDFGVYDGGGSSVGTSHIGVDTSLIDDSRLFHDLVLGVVSDETWWVDSGEDTLGGATLDLNGLQPEDFLQRPDQEPNDVSQPSGYPPGYTQTEWKDGGTMTVRLGGDTLNLSTSERVDHTIEVLERALGRVSGGLAQVGTAQDRLGFKGENLSTSINSYEAARSRIVDTDFAQEQFALTKLQILQQTGKAALTQANAAPQSVLSLLGPSGGSPFQPGGGISYQPTYQQAVSAYERFSG